MPLMARKRAKPTIPSPAVAEAQRGILKGILKAIQRRPKPHSHSVWDDSPFPEILETVQGLAREQAYDGRQLDAYGESFFSSAREAHRHNRPRAVLSNLYWALAFFFYSSNLGRIIAALNNLAVALREVTQYEKALFLQEFCLDLKRSSGATSEAIGRAHAEIGEIHYRKGNYELALQHMLQAKSDCPYYENIDGRIKFMETRIQLRDELTAAESAAGETADRPEYLLLTANKLEQEGKFPEAAIGYAQVASLARTSQDAATELRAHLNLATVAYRDLGLYAQASGQYATALPLADKLDDPKSKFDALVGMGRVAGEMGRLSEMQTLLENALGLAGASIPSENKLELHATVSLVCLMRNKQNDADEHLRAGLGAIRNSNTVEAAIATLIRVSQQFRCQDFFDQALRCLDTAAELQLQLPPASTNADEAVLSGSVYEHIAGIYWALKNPRVAADFLNIAVGYAKDSGNRELIASILAKLADCLGELGFGKEAKEASELASKLAGGTDDPSLIRLVVNSVLNASRASAEPLLEQSDARRFLDESRAFFGLGFEARFEWLRARIHQAEARQDEASLPALYLEVASHLSRINQAYEAGRYYRLAFHQARQQQRLELLGVILQNYGALMAHNYRAHSARRAFRIALACKDKFASGRDRGTSLVCLAQVNLILGDRSEAVRLAADAEHSLASLTGQDRVQGLSSLAQLDRDLGHTNAGLAKLDEALPSLESEGPWEDFIYALICASDLHRAQHDLNSARCDAERALGELEANRNRTLPPYRRFAQRMRDPALRALLRTLYRLGFEHAARALSELEQARCRGLIERLGERTLSSPASLPNELKSKEIELLSALAAKEEHGSDPAILAESDPVLHNGVRKHAEEARQALYDFWDGLPAQWANYGKLRQGKVIDLARLLKTNEYLCRGHILVLHAVGGETYVWNIQPGGQIANWKELPISRADATKVCKFLLSALEDRRTTPQECMELCGQLSSYIEGFPPAATICIIPGGPFINFPFAALRCSGQYLIERNPLVLLPSLSIVSYWDIARARKTQTKALVLGDSLGDLPHARNEAEAIARFFSARAYVGTAVSRDLIRFPPHSVDLLHVACHARYDGHDPERSGFYLADQTLCTARDLQAGLLTARLAVLSACESGRQYIGEGDDNIGLPASLLYAGVPSVVATLWKVSDRATLDLMLSFYRELQQNGADAARALRTSQCEALARRGRRHPYYWPPFSYTGDGRIF